MFNQIVKASMGAYSVPAVLHAVQGDDGRVLVFHIEDYTLTGSETASLMCIRPNGSAFSYAGVVDGVNQKITVALDQEGGALTQTGVVAAQLIVALSGETVCTFKLGIIVEEALGGEATAEDVEFLAELQAQLDQAIGNFVQTSREINGHPLSANISLTAADVGAVPTSRTVNGLSLQQNQVLKSAQFSESVTGEKMLANIKYTNGNFTNGIKFDGKLLDAVSIGGYKKTLTSTDDLDVLYTRADSGLYYCGNSVQNCPASFCMLAMVATGSDSNSVTIQAVFSASYIYVRVRSGSGSSFSWGAWRRVAISTWS